MSLNALTPDLHRPISPDENRFYYYYYCRRSQRGRRRPRHPATRPVLQRGTIYT